MKRDHDAVARRRHLKTVREAVADLRRLQQDIAARPSRKAKLTWRDFRSFVEVGRK